MSYPNEPAFEHGSVEKTGIVLLNLGTPDAPTAASVRAYLKAFLSDPRVVEIPRLVWWFVLNGIILNVRPKKSAAKYASVWTQDGSPLRVHTERQTALLNDFLTEHAPAEVEVVYAMRYGNPSIPGVLRQLKQRNCQRILLLPLYPQYAASTTATALDEVCRELQRMRSMPAIRTIKHFHDVGAYIQASVQNIRDYWDAHGRPEKLVMSFHGLPRYTLEKGDPYYCECQKTGRLIAEGLGLSEAQYTISFQSRFGRTEWLQPYTTAVLHALGEQRAKRVDVVCPGFVADCLETLEEIALEGKADFLQAGGGEYHYIPCLNERPDWIRALGAMALENLQGWLNAPDVGALADGKIRAQALGAVS